MIYPSGVPSKASIANIVDGVTPRNAASIENGVAYQIQKVMDYVNASNCGTSSSPIAVGYFSQLGTSGNKVGDIYVDGSTSSVIKMGTTQRYSQLDSIEISLLDYSSTQKDSSFSATNGVTLTNFNPSTFELSIVSLGLNGVSYLDYLSSGYVQSKVNFDLPNQKTTFTNVDIDVDGDIDITDGDLIVENGDINIQDGCINGGGIKHEYDKISSSGTLTENQNIIGAGWTSGDLYEYLPTITNSLLGQRYTLYYDFSGSVGDFTVVTDGTDKFFGLANGTDNTTATLSSQGDFIEVIAVEMSSTATGYGWLVIAHNGVTYN